MAEQPVKGSATAKGIQDHSGYAWSKILREFYIPFIVKLPEAILKAKNEPRT